MRNRGISFAGLIFHWTTTLPSGRESAPYLDALVANSMKSSPARSNASIWTNAVASPRGWPENPPSDGCAQLNLMREVDMPCMAVSSKSTWARVNPPCVFTARSPEVPSLPTHR
jgi:hypothetical protein